MLPCVELVFSVSTLFLSHPLFSLFATHLAPVYLYIVFCQLMLLPDVLYFPISILLISALFQLTSIYRCYFLLGAAQQHGCRES